MVNGESKKVYCPDVNLSHSPDLAGCTLHETHGFNHTWTVMRNGQALGWVFRELFPAGKV